MKQKKRISKSFSSEKELRQHIGRNMVYAESCGKNYGTGAHRSIKDYDRNSKAGKRQKQELRNWQD